MTLTGLNARGQAVTNPASGALPGYVIVPVSHRAVVDAGPFTARSLFSGAGDGPDANATNGRAPFHLKTPTQWVLRFSAGGSIRFPNTIMHPDGPPDGPFASCGGGIELGMFGGVNDSTTLNNGS